MKKTILCLSFFTAIGFAYSQNVNIPDANFKAYLIGNSSINTNMDTEIQVSEASAFSGTINCSNLNISDLTGISAFTSLAGLYCNDNSLTSLNLSSNTALSILHCYYNSIDILEVSNNLALTDLRCFGNQLTNLDVSENAALTKLSCTENLLTTLNVKNGNNTNFTMFFAGANPNLTCIQVDDATYSTTNWTNIDAGASFSLDCGSSVGQENLNFLQTKIYPNPAKFNVSIETNSTINSIQIVDLTGAVVQTETKSSFSIELLNNGVYLMNIKTDNGTVTKRLIKE